MSLTLSIRENNGVSVVDLSGRVTMGEGASALRDTLRDITANGQLRILLNLGEVSYIDSSGMGLLVSSFATIAGLGGQLKLLNMTVRVKDLLLITKLYTVFEAYDDEASAIASFDGVPAKAPTL
jgi:anti-sigma B factor antagonist